MSQFSVKQIEQGCCFFFADTLRTKQSENYLTTNQLFLKTNRVCATWLSNDVSQMLTASEPNCFSFVFILHLSFAVFFKQRRGVGQDRILRYFRHSNDQFLRASFMSKPTLRVKTVMVKRIKTSNFNTLYMLGALCITLTLCCVCFPQGAKCNIGSVVVVSPYYLRLPTKLLILSHFFLELKK